MPKLSQKLKEMWSFFIDPITHKRKYYAKCSRCERECKQSFRIKELECPRYDSKRKKEGNRASERSKEDG